mmetsp:Transcript_22965/g.41357  ORF Transcript_22965/g.41357 Transcript_22965/m.41357 type:complete len:399 (-) Transcript_22965:211-1407(-)
MKAIKVNVARQERYRFLALIVIVGAFMMWSMGRQRDLLRQLDEIRALKDAPFKCPSCPKPAPPCPDCRCAGNLARLPDAPCKYHLPTKNHFSFTINVFTYNRIDGLRRLWQSLLSADYMGIQVDMVLFHDKKNNAEERDGTDQWIQTEAYWPFGNFRVHKRVINVGLRRSIMEAWYPVQENTFAAFFEDDLEVSPLWFKWVRQGLQKYYFTPQRHPKMMGFALYRPMHDELTERLYTVDNDHAPFALQQPCSWGSVWFPAPWRYFREWMTMQTADPKISDFHISSNTWHASSSWKKYLIRLMYDKGLFMIYPNLPDKTVLSTNHFMKGEHPTPNYKLYHLPLLTDSKYNEELAAGKDIFKFPPVDTLAVLDLRVHKVNGLDALPHASEPFKPTDFASD